MSDRGRIEKDRTRELGALRELSGLAFLRYLWRLLTSMRTALVLLLLLALASIPGSIIPQRAQNPFQVQDFFEANPTIAPIFDRLYLFDVFGAPWFSAIYVLLFISLIGCVVPRLNEYRKAIFDRPSEPPTRIDNFIAFHSFEADPMAVVNHFKKKRYRVSEFSDGYSFEKGYLKESGNLLFHFSMILILVGIAFSSLFGMRGDAIVNVGERFINTPVTYDNLTPGRFYSIDSLQPYRIELEEFYAEYDPVTNAAREYELKVRVRDDLDSPFRDEVVRVNSPLTFGASRVFLQATGYSVLVTVRDRNGDVTFQGSVPLLPIDPNLTSTGTIKVPDMEPSIGFVASFLPTAARDEIRGGFSAFPEPLDPRLLLGIWQGDLGMDDGRPQSIYRIETEGMERIGLVSLREGEFYDFSVGSITFDGFVPWINLQVIHDPGKSYALAGGLLALLGALGMLFIHKRRIWLKIDSKNGSNQIEIAGFSNTNEELVKREIDALLDEMEVKRDG